MKKPQKKIAKKASTETHHDRLAHFLFELGTMRKIPRAHMQTLLTTDLSDNIASHSYRVTMIAWILAKLEGADPYKVVMMALTHDMGEIRSGDHNWIHKKYVKIFEDEIAKDQLGTLPFSDLFDISHEYVERKSKEALIAKDADLIDQILLLKEYMLQGNQEAGSWLGFGENPKHHVGDKAKQLKTESGRKIAEKILKHGAADWWGGVWTNANR
ncbi:MAG: HD domain-containing protein [Patescibacteria group bacterium]